MIVQVWTLKRGRIDPPEPLEAEHSAWCQDLWWMQDYPVEVERMSRWRELYSSLSATEPVGR
jgi:hypothetical protein